MASSALVDVAYTALKDATNSMFSLWYSDCWDAFILHLGPSLDDIVEAAFAAAAAGDAKAQFVVARRIRGNQVLDSLKLPIPHWEMRQVMKQNLKSAAKQGLGPALRKWERPDAANVCKLF